MLIPASTKPIIDYVAQELNNCTKRPLIVGLSGPQGSGKSTVVASVAKMLRSESLNVVQFSLDDVYLTHSDQKSLFKKTQNPLMSRRGLPGTHDVDLCDKVFQALLHQQPVQIPEYDKSAFDGEGDRSHMTNLVKPLYDVVLFEGWMVGFEPLSESQLILAYNKSQREHGLAAKYRLEDLRFVNDQLGSYSKKIWSEFDIFVHLEAIDIKNVYRWRTEQEHSLIKSKGRGMSDEKVVEFVDGYMPAYELYDENLKHRSGFHLKLDAERQVRSKAIIENEKKMLDK